jgi:hypothetical protein
LTLGCAATNAKATIILDILDGDFSSWGITLLPAAIHGPLSASASVPGSGGNGAYIDTKLNFPGGYSVCCGSSYVVAIKSAIIRWGIHRHLDSHVHAHVARFDPRPKRHVYGSPAAAPSISAAAQRHISDFSSPTTRPSPRTSSVTTTGRSTA